MSQRYLEFLHDDDTASLNRWLLGLIQPGVYRGFLAGEGTGTSSDISQANGIVQTLRDGMVTAPTGVIMTRQGIVVQETATVTVPHTIASISLDRYDVIFLQHLTPDGIAGGAEVTYGVKEGIASSSPDIPSLDSPNVQIALCVVLIPAGVTMSSDYTYTNVRVPNLADKQEQESYSNKGTIEITPNGYYAYNYELNTVYNPGSNSTLNKTGFFIVEAAQALGMGLPQIAMAIFTLGDGITTTPLVTKAIQFAYGLTALAPGVRNRTFKRIRVVDVWGPWGEVYGNDVIDLGTFNTDNGTNETSASLYGYFIKPVRDGIVEVTPITRLLPTGKYYCKIFTFTNNGGIFGLSGLKDVFMDVTTIQISDTGIKYLSSVIVYYGGINNGNQFIYKGTEIGSNILTSADLVQYPSAIHPRYAGRCNNVAWSYGQDVTPISGVIFTNPDIYISNDSIEMTGTILVTGFPRQSSILLAITGLGVALPVRVASPWAEAIIILSKVNGVTSYKISRLLFIPNFTNDTLELTMTFEAGTTDAWITLTKIRVPLA